MTIHPPTHLGLSSSPLFHNSSAANEQLIMLGGWRVEIQELILVCKSIYLWKVIHLNCMERYEDKYDHRIYIHNLSSCEIKAWKKNQAWMGFEPMTTMIPVLYQLSYQPTASWLASSQFAWIDSSVGRAPVSQRSRVQILFFNFTAA